MKAGTLYLIPSTLGPGEPSTTIPNHVAEIVERIDDYIVESAGAATRFLGRLRRRMPAAGFAFQILNKETPPEAAPALLAPLLEGRDVGLLSEAGCPGIADPGAQVVRAAHERGIAVKPLVGPSSILLALMASGFNGQRFLFHGYLPAERAGRIAALREIELDLYARDRTQVFIEAPHRNQHLLSDILGNLREMTRLCVAIDLTLPTELVASRPIRDWKREAFEIGKRPAVFLLYR